LRERRLAYRDAIRSHHSTESELRAHFDREENQLVAALNAL